MRDDGPPGTRARPQSRALARLQSGARAPQQAEARARPGLRRRPLAADSLAVFDPQSWRTHIVGGAAAMLLTLFAERGAQRLDALVETLELAEAGFSSEEAQMLVEKALSELLGCDLIELVGPVCAS
jgi:PqqD family protein of HPr-rel-A system